MLGPAPVSVDAISVTCLVMRKGSLREQRRRTGLLWDVVACVCRPPLCCLGSFRVVVTCILYPLLLCQEGMLLCKREHVRYV